MKNKILLVLTGMCFIAITSLVMAQSENGNSDTETIKSDSHSEEANDEGDENTGPHDPFHLPKKRTLSHQMPGGVQVGQWHLTGILVSISGERLAILNDRLVSEGDKVSGGQVDRIYPDSVIIKGTFGTRELKILSFSSEGHSE